MTGAEDTSDGNTVLCATSVGRVVGPPDVSVGFAGLEVADGGKVGNN